MQSPLQPQPFAPVRMETLFADVVPLDRRVGRGFPRRKALELRAASGSVLGLARFEVRKGHLLVSKFASRNSELGVGLQLVRCLRDEARYMSAEEIWLEARSNSRRDDFYRACGFQKKGFFREDPGNPLSREVTIWCLKAEPVLRHEFAQLLN